MDKNKGISDAQGYRPTDNQWLSLYLAIEGYMYISDICHKSIGHLMSHAQYLIPIELLTKSDLTEQSTSLPVHINVFNCILLRYVTMGRIHRINTNDNWFFIFCFGLYHTWFKGKCTMQYSIQLIVKDNTTNISWVHTVLLNLKIRSKT